MYYLVIIQNDSTQAIYAYQTLDAALSAFHSELAYRDESRTKTVCSILNNVGELIKREHYVKEVIPSPEEE